MIPRLSRLSRHLLVLWASILITAAFRAGRPGRRALHDNRPRHAVGPVVERRHLDQQPGTGRRGVV